MGGRILQLSARQLQILLQGLEIGSLQWAASKLLRRSDVSCIRAAVSFLVSSSRVTGPSLLAISAVSGAPTGGRILRLSGDSELRLLRAPTRRKKRLREEERTETEERRESALGESSRL